MINFHKVGKLLLDMLNPVQKHRPTSDECLNNELFTQMLDEEWICYEKYKINELEREIMLCVIYYNVSMKFFPSRYISLLINFKCQKQLYNFHFIFEQISQEIARRIIRNELDIRIIRNELDIRIIINE
ncbi:hypothetical protein TRFO_14228 [Tritrichomonas foetus]|uniref:Uncharacterized protein n=1 Tax=Tritrichomonas foetus TaxID=1144522 RepID=A0A1J4L0D6_9EUKA|nr:hypothetical protein TRFO_14228 [Tritrichomonas foetus]|eukprot:OHT15317.1 hypothetical protein TRFO_14228 [Tritrichomonas foetus]